MIEEQEKKNYNNLFYKKLHQIAAVTLDIEIDKVTDKKKSIWKKQVNGKEISKVKKRMSEEMVGRTKYQTIENDK